MTTARRILLVHGIWSGPGTWGRVAPGLTARGWYVEQATLAGHGGRPIGEVRTVPALAEDAITRHAGPWTLVVGHSLGAVVALAAAAADPAYAAGVLLVDPPGRSSSRGTRSRGRERAQEAAQARSDPHGAVATLLHGHPTWTRQDARSVLEGLLTTDPALAELSPRELVWDLTRLIGACPVTVGLVAARGSYSALGEPDRGAVLKMLAREHVTELPGSHHVHLDHPSGWVDAVDAFGRTLS